MLKSVKLLRIDCVFVNSIILDAIFAKPYYLSVGWEEKFASFRFFVVALKLFNVLLCNFLILYIIYSYIIAENFMLVGLDYWFRTPTFQWLPITAKILKLLFSAATNSLSSYHFS